MTTTNTAFKTPGALQRGPGTISLLALYQKRPPSGASHRGSVFSFFHSTGILSHRAPSRSALPSSSSSPHWNLLSHHLISTQLNCIFFSTRPTPKRSAAACPSIPSHHTLRSLLLFFLFAACRRALHPLISSQNAGRIPSGPHRTPYIYYTPAAHPHTLPCRPGARLPLHPTTLCPRRPKTNRKM